MLESFLLSVFRRLSAASQASFLRKASAQSEPAQFSIALGDFIAVAYGNGHGVAGDELLRVRSILGKDSIKSVSDARAVIMALDQQKFPTPMLIRFSADDVGFAQVNGISCALDRRDMSTSAYGAHWHEYEPNLVACFRKICKAGSVVCDIGANVGFHSLMLSSLVGKSGHVYAFEPNSENCRLILLGAEHNHASNITLVPVALSDTRGWSYFSTHIGSNGGFVDQQIALAQGHGTIVPTFTLDEMCLPRVDVIKVDVEGAEYRVLKGGAQLLSRDRPAIVCEFSVEMTQRVSGVRAPEFLNWIERLGYGIFVLDRARCEAVATESVAALLSGWGDPGRIEDLLFLPHDRHDLVEIARATA